MNVLSIEDEADIGILIQRVMMSAGVPVKKFLRVETIEEGLLQIAEFRPTLVLLDLKLPCSEIDEVLASIPIISKVAPVIVLSGAADQYFTSAIELGAADCIQKTLFLNPRSEAFFAHHIALAIAHFRRNQRIVA